MFSEDCVDGSAKLGADGIPYLFWGGKWSPICGHWFWDNQEGAKAFCRELGYPDGKLQRPLFIEKVYEIDAIEVGRCGRNEDIDSCTAGHNYYRNTPDCKAGSRTKITITCSGLFPGSEKASCTGKTILNIACLISYE